jgi:hypothetical protein
MTLLFYVYYIQMNPVCHLFALPVFEASAMFRRCTLIPHEGATANISFANTTTYFFKNATTVFLSSQIRPGQIFCT